MPAQSIGNLFKSEHAVAGLYIAILAAAAGEIIPDPSDAVYFSLDRKWRVQLEKGEITPEQYWKYKTAAYFLIDFLWWMLIFVVAVSIKGDIRDKAIVVGGIVGGGALIGIVAENIRKDKEFFETYKFVARQ